MTSNAPPFGHHVLGCIHELLPADGSPETLAELLRHECDECHGARVFVDLTDRPEVDERHVDVIVETVTPDGERWSFSLPPDVDPEILRRIRDAGYSVVEHHRRP